MKPYLLCDMAICLAISAFFSITEFPDKLREIVARRWLLWFEVVGLLTLLWEIYLLRYFPLSFPGPGKNVVALAVAAGVMSLQPDMKPTHKVTWIVILFGFGFMEIRSIDFERHRFEQERAATRELENARFAQIASGLTQTVNQGKAAAEALRETIINTQPRAFILLDRFIPVTVPKQLAPNDTVRLNVWWKDTGPATATHIVFGWRSYVDKPDDERVQRALATDFNSWWDRSRPSRKLKNNPAFLQDAQPGERELSTIETDRFTTADIKDLADHTKTLYVLLRWTFTDETGSWASDWCAQYQDIRNDFEVLHFCHAHANHHYALRTHGSGR